jgi:hypothetical protein
VRREAKRRDTHIPLSSSLADRSLVQGTLKYGFGNYGLMLRDLSFRWNKPLGAVATAPPASVGADDDDDDKDDKDDEDDEEEPVPAATSATPSASAASASKPVDPRETPRDQGWPLARMLDARLRALLQQMGKSDAELSRQREKERKHAMR